MTIASPLAPSVSGFAPFPSALQEIAPTKLYEARVHIAGLERNVLQQKFSTAFTNGKRVAAFLLSEELTKRGIPPTFRHSHSTATDYTINQKFDLMMYDLRWFRHAHLNHVKRVRYVRYRDLLTAGEIGFHRAAAYAFYEGRRPAWKIVASLSMTEEQQFDCHWLRSAPVAKRHALAQAKRDRIYAALQDDLRTVRRMRTFDDDDANITLLRRHALWVCSQMTGGSPSETAARYTQMTGKESKREFHPTLNNARTAGPRSGLRLWRN